jgi:putative transposase
LRRHGIVQSMNRPGQMNDNAHMESFFHSLKSEFLSGKQFDSDQELRQTLHTYLQYYNHTRLHSSLEHTSPSRLRTTHDLKAASRVCGAAHVERLGNTNASI